MLNMLLEAISPLVTPYFTLFLLSLLYAHVFTLYMFVGFVICEKSGVFDEDTDEVEFNTVGNCAYKYEHYVGERGCKPSPDDVCKPCAEQIIRDCLPNEK